MDYNLAVVPQVGFEPPTPHHELAAKLLEQECETWLGLEKCLLMLWADASRFQFGLTAVRIAASVSRLRRLDRLKGLRRGVRSELKD